MSAFTAFKHIAQQIKANQRKLTVGDYIIAGNAKCVKSVYIQYRNTTKIKVM